MAIVKIPTAVHARLDKVIAYATKPKGIEEYIKGAIDYAIDPEKQQGFELKSCINCKSVDTAYAEMMDTLKAWDKLEYGKSGCGRIAYRLIQSFSPDDDVDPAIAHEIGVRLAEEYFGDRYQVVVGTHLDKAHIHNHIIINAVSFVDGEKYRDSLHYLYEIRAISDRLCKEYGLSVIKDRQGKTMPYKTWQDNQTKAPTRQALAKSDIDKAIAASMSMREFARAMEQLGYTVRYGDNVKHMTIKHRAWERARRVYQYGEEYTEAAIRERIGNVKERTPLPLPVSRTRRRYVQRPFNRRRTHAKVRGVRALYWRYVYQLRNLSIRPQNRNRYVAYKMRDELTRLNRYNEQMTLMRENNIETVEGLTVYVQSMLGKMKPIEDEYNKLRKKRKHLPPGKVQDALIKRLNELTAAARPIRKEINICKAIMERIPNMEKTLADIERELYAKPKETEMKKGEMEHGKSRS